MKKSMFKYLPNVLTLINMMFGMLVILLVIRNSEPETKLICAMLILTGGVIDGFDGALARYLNAVTDIGKQLDSFADLLTFGVAPMCLLSSLSFWRESDLFIFFLWIFPLAGAFRLARYNLSTFSKHFVGLPITIAGMLITVFCVVSPSIQTVTTESFCGSMALFLIIMLSAMMVSTVKIKRLRLLSVKAYLKK